MTPHEPPNWIPDSIFHDPLAEKTDPTLQEEHPGASNTEMDPIRPRKKSTFRSQSRTARSEAIEAVARDLRILQVERAKRKTSKE
ncbi:hypothetical protein ARZXY2_4757 (plasmid) [Arthrobacter sp. ZXY-2]|nr:hypothetical protein ARZXY2_4757 [Arthrobacter sp. ZXY-2]